MSRNPRRTLRFVSVLSMVAALLTAVAVSPASAAPVVVASTLTPAADVNLNSHTNSNAGAFASAGDGFEIYQRGISPSIPFSVLDDSLVTFPPDTLGIVDDNNLAPFFGATDTENPENVGPVTATWEFDISGATDLELSIDMGAMGDFEANDTFSWTYSIDAGTTASAFSSSVDEAGTRNYTLASGTAVSLDDPMNVGSAALSNVLQPVVAPLNGSGAVLTLSLTVVTDGGSEAMAFQNIVISGETGGGPSGPAPGDLVINEVMQNPNVVGDNVGEWFEILNVSGAAIDINGWTISDAGSDSHVINNGGPLVVPAGGFVVLGNNTNSGTNGGVTVNYGYGGSFFLANGDDELVLTAPGPVEYDRIEWDGGPVWPDPNGASMNLDPDSADIVSNDGGANWCDATSVFGAGDSGTPGAANTECVVIEPPAAVVQIHEIQGSGSSVAITTPVEVTAIVTSLFTRDDVLDGFFIQEPDLEVDGDVNTSEGIFVFCRGNCPTVSVGDEVTVTGTPEDFFGMSQISIAFGGGTTTVVSSVNPLPSATPIDLPASGDTEAEATFEATEGMIVSFPDTLAVSEYFELARYGQVVLTETARPYQFTDENAPSVAGYAAFLADLATRRIILDDDNNDQNDPISDGADEAYFYPNPGLSTTNRFRGGDTISNLTGVMHWSFAGQGGTDAWRVRPIAGVDYTFTPFNPAPASPDEVGGDITVASFNVLNYFTTLDVRGADSIAELDRQRAKIVAAIVEMDADVVGIIEVENDAGAATADLVAGLNASAGAGTYDFLDTGKIGTDQIKVGFIYQPANVSPVGDFAILDSSVDPTFIDTKNRPALIQTFQRNDSEGRLTVAVNHLKSKGSSCADVGDPEPDDGQASCAATRTAAAVALANYLETDPTGSGDPDFLIIGDLNSYAMEDPIMALIAAGYTDLLNAFEGADAYSYLFDGQLGYLDYALANSALLGQVTGTTAWHINADEIPLFDYNDDIRDVPGEASFERESGVLELYAPDALRSSDHDPVLVGINVPIPANPTCMGLPATIIGTPGADTIIGTNGPDVIVAFGGDDTILAGNGDDVICAGYGNDTIDAGNGNDIIDAGFGDDTVDSGRGDDRVDAGAGNDTVVGNNGDDVLVGGAGTDDLDGGRGFDQCTEGENLLACELS